jgi:hypothetical protein
VPADPDTFGSNEVGGGMPFDDQLSAVTLVLTVLARKSSAILTEP